MNKILDLEFIPKNKDFALLVLRIWIGFSLFIQHGLFKFMHFSQLWGHFLDPLHLGSNFSLIFSTVADGICSVLIAFGISTRLAALISAIDVFIVFAVVRHFSFSNGDGELVYLYLGALITIILMGAGKYSLDNKFRGVK
jgi:putative oxidoreductase